MGARWARRGCELGLLHLRLGRGQTLAPEDIQEEDPTDPKVGEHKGQPSFSGLSGDLVCVHCVVGRLCREAVKDWAWSPQKDPNDQSM